MILLNTVPHLGGKWPATVTLWAVDLLTMKECIRAQRQSCSITASKKQLLECAGPFPFKCEPKHNDANFLQRCLNVKDVRARSVCGFWDYCIYLPPLHKQVGLGFTLGSMVDLGSKTILAITTLPPALFTHSPFEKGPSCTP